MKRPFDTRENNRRPTIYHRGCSQTRRVDVTARALASICLRPPPVHWRWLCPQTTPSRRPTFIYICSCEADPLITNKLCVTVIYIQYYCTRQTARSRAVRDYFVYNWFQEMWRPQTYTHFVMQEWLYSISYLNNGLTLKSKQHECNVYTQPTAPHLPANVWPH